MREVYLIRVLGYIIDFIEMVIAGKMIFSLKYQYKKQYSIILAGVAMIIALCIWFQVGIFGEVLLLAKIVILYFIIKNENKVYYIIFLYLYTSIIQNLIMTYGIYGFGMSSDYWRSSNPKGYIIGSLLALFIVIIISLLFRIFVRKYIDLKYKITAKSYIILVVLGLLDFIIITSGEAFIGGILPDKAQKLALLGYMLFSLVMLWIIIILNSVMDFGKYYRDMYELHERLDILQKEKYEMMKKANDEVRQINHDFKFHMMTLRNMTKNNQETTEYIDDIVEAMPDFSFNTTGNVVIDSIVSGYLKRIDDSAINYEQEGHVYSQLDIEDVDLCVAFGNLFENAIDEAERCTENRFVKLVIGCLPTGLSIDIYNSISDDTEYVYKTKKKDKLNHGFGLKNVRRALDKYEGILYEFKIDNRCAIARLIIPYKN